MAWVTDAFRATWRSGEHLGAHAPHCVVQVRRGNWRRAYRAWAGDDVHATIPDEDPTQPWYPIFTETTPWVDVPNVLSCDLTQSFDQNGMQVATIAVDNVVYEQRTGAMGLLYHVISRGYLAPERGYDPPTRPDSGLATNEWYDVLTEQANLRIWQGFGPPARGEDGSMPTDGGPNGAWVFNGLIDDVDPDADPARLTITARMGKTLTDQRVFGWNKSKQLKDPVIFADPDSYGEVKNVGDTPDCSSQVDSAHGPDNVIDDESTTRSYWYSQDHSSPAVTEWVEIHVPKGRYHDFILNTDADMELYVGFYVRPIDGDTSARVDGDAHDEGWVAVGLGTVPGTYGGWNFLYYSPQTSTGRNVIDFGHTIECGDNSVLRVGFRNLHTSASTDPTSDYRARVRELQARQRKIITAGSEAAKKWILVNDVSDMVKVVLRWAGFTEWEVEDAGVPIKGKFTVNRSSYLIDIIKAATDQTGFVFFVADPTDGDSIGLPTFRRNAALQRGLQIEDVRDTDLLTAVKAKRSEESLGYIIRVRGRESKTGSTLGGDTTKRIMYVYRPPWTQDNTLGGIIKHVTHTDNALRSLLECEIGCYLIAIAEALQASTAVVEIPGNPALELDDQIGLLDTATGINQRLWVSSRSSRLELGENTSWKTTLTGSLIDSADLVALINEIAAIDFTPQPSPVAAGTTRRRRTR